MTEGFGEGSARGRGDEVLSHAPGAAVLLAVDTAGDALPIESVCVFFLLFLSLNLRDSEDCEPQGLCHPQLCRLA